MEEDGLAFGASGTHGAGGELDGCVPIDVRPKEWVQKSDGAIVSGVDRFHGVKGYV